MDITKVREDFEQYMKSKYPFGDLSRVGEGYANYHTESLWQLYTNTMNNFDRVFKEL